MTKFGSYYRLSNEAPRWCWERCTFVVNKFILICGFKFIESQNFKNWAAILAIAEMKPEKMWYLVIISSFFFFNIPTGSYQIASLPLFIQLYPQSPSQRHFSSALQPVKGSHLVTHIRSGCRLVRRHFDSPKKEYRWISKVGNCIGWSKFKD